MLMQLLGGGDQGGMGGMGGAGMSGMSSMPGMPSSSSEGGGDWLTELINSTHEAMVSESDPATVSVLGKIIDLLTTVQAKKAQGGRAN